MAEPENMYCLLINAGSSSVKYKLFDMRDESVSAKGIAARVGTEKSYLAHTTTNKEEVKVVVSIPDSETAVELIADILIDPEHGVMESLGEISAVGHRVVHGGDA